MMDVLEHIEDDCAIMHIKITSKSKVNLSSQCQHISFCGQNMTKTTCITEDTAKKAYSGF